MNSLQKLIAIQKKEGWTHLEVSTMLEIPENTWKKWVYGIRTPQGPAKNLIKHVLLVLQDKPITRQQLLAKTGRTDKLSAETMQEHLTDKRGQPQ